MNKIEQIKCMQEYLVQIGELTEILSVKLCQLQDITEANKFIPPELNESICTDLVKIGNAQKEFQLQYESLGLEEMPSVISEAEKNLEECIAKFNKLQGYADITKAFLSLCSNDEEISTLLKEKQDGLRAYIQDTENDEAPILLIEKFITAYKEVDDQKRFQLVLELSNYFDGKVLFAMNAGKLLEKDIESADEELIEKHFFGPATGDNENKNISEINEQELTVQEEVDVLEGTTAVSDETEDEISSHEDAMEESEQTEEYADEEITWNDLGIDSPELIVSCADDYVMEKEISHKAMKRFGVKEFKNDMSSYPMEDKLTTLAYAFSHGSVTVKTLAAILQKEFSVGLVESVLEKLYRLGYLSRIKVEPYEPVYFLTERGMAIFESKEATKFLIKNSGFTSNYDSDLYERMWRISDFDVRTALSNLCMSSRIDHIKKFEPDNTGVNFEGAHSRYGSMLLIETEDYGCVTFFTVVSDRPKMFYDSRLMLIENLNLEKQNTIVVIEPELDKAKKIALWLKYTFTKNAKYYYGALEDKDNIYELRTDNGFDPTTKKLVPENTETDVSEKIPEEISVSTEADEIINVVVEQEIYSEETAEDMIEDAVEDIPNKEDEEHKTENEKLVEKPVFTKTSDYPASEKHEGKEAAVSNEQLLKCKSLCHNMLEDEKYYAATAYLKTLADTNSRFKSEYNQLAYALNDPLASCTYSSAQLFDIYFGAEDVASDYFIVSAILRNYFYDQYSYDYSLQQLNSAACANPVLRKYPALDSIMYALMKFKNENHCGIDKFADYREKERLQKEHRLDKVIQEAKTFYDNYILTKMKETAPHRRFMETRALLLSPTGEIAQHLKIVKDGEKDKEIIDILAEYLKEKFIKDAATINAENIDPEKINAMLDDYWNRAAEKVITVKKTSDLMSSLRTTLFKQVKKIADMLCDYVAIMQSFTAEEDATLFAYKKVRTSLLDNMNAAIDEIKADGKEDTAGKNVLIKTLKELIARLDGNYNEKSNKFFYIDFLRTNDILLDDSFMPELEKIPELPAMSPENRIIYHYLSVVDAEVNDKDSISWNERLEGIISGQDDYGSAKLILKYGKQMGVDIDEKYMDSFDFEKAVTYPRKDMENKKTAFIEDLELAQSYGQIDNTIENQKEMIIQVMEFWYGLTLESENFGFFSSLLNAFKHKIKEDAQVRADDLKRDLESLLSNGSLDEEDEDVARIINQIDERIVKQNYAAAEDLLNRLVAGDIGSDVTSEMTDYFQMFLDEYDNIARRTANAGQTLHSLVKQLPKDRKDARGAERLIDCWPKGNGVGAAKTKDLMTALGFVPDEVKQQKEIAGKIENYTVSLKKPENGRKSNYKHPISAFGSRAEDKGFRVVYLHGKMDADRLIDICKEIGNAKDTLICLDYSLTLPERRKLARKMKTEIPNRIYGVIDRVVLAFIASHYMETAVNRMLMSIILPFTYCQPYIDKSADVMPAEMFMGRKNELQKIEDPNGVNIVYGGRQLGKSALLRMAQKNINNNENNDRALIVDLKGCDYKSAAKRISAALYDERILKAENITENWDVLARDIKNRLRDTKDEIPYLLLLLDEADSFIESCEEVGYKPFDALKDIQSVGSGRFKFVVAGLRNIVRFKKNVALGNNSVLTHLESLTVTPFKYTEARELLEVPLHYLGFRFDDDAETEVLISTILGTTNYFPGLLQLYCTKLIEAMKKDYAGYSENDTPTYRISKDHIKKVLAEQGLQQEIRDKFFITLKVGEDDFYYILALLVAYHYHEYRSKNGCSVEDVLELAELLDITKVSELGADKLGALMEEMRELNVLQLTAGGRYRFARHSFCQMMGTISQLDEELYKYMEV